MNPEKLIDRFWTQAPPDRAEIEGSAGRVLRNLEAQYESMPLQRVQSWDTVRRRPGWRWGTAAVVAVLLVAIGVMVLHDVPRSKESSSAGDAGITVSLSDGSRVELSANSEYSVTDTPGGIELRLEKGNVIVTAAKQVAGRFSVRTPDCTVVVRGTVFSVRAAEQGSRVSVYEGQVEVIQRERSYTLDAGEQIATSPVLGLSPMETEIQWSRSAATVLALLRPTQAVAAIPGEESIEGIVTDVTTGQPLSGVSILLGQGNSPRTFAEVKTAADGRFKMERVTPGAYYVVASLVGYWAPDPPRMDVQVASRETVTNVRLRMIQAASLSGRVVDENGQPFKSVPIVLMQSQSGGLRGANAGAGGITTNERGEFSFPDVLPGKYYVRLPGNPSRPAGIFYPGTANPDEALPIDLKPGAKVTGIDFTTPKVEYYNVRFTTPRNALLWFDTTYRQIGPGGFADTNMRTPSAKAPETPTIFNLRLQRITRVNDSQGDIGRGLDNFRPVGNDEYLIPRVSPGKYRLFVEWDGGMAARPDGTRVQSTASVRTEFEVIDRDIHLGILASKPRNLSIPVLFEFANGQESDVTVAVLGEARDSVNSKAAARPLRLDNLIAGSYSLSFTTPPDQYIASARYGGQEVLSTPLVLDGSVSGSLQVVVDGPPGSVEGVVRDARGDTVPSVRVVLAPTAPGRGLQSVVTDREGRFQFEKIVPGEYRLYSWEFSTSQGYSDPEWLREYETRATPVTVRKGQTVSANLRLILAAR
jgi:5-hydroxyisourate hydrolase-like protein (transthyretin family)